MCRMAGFISVKEEKTGKYLNAVKFQAEHGSNAPHKDGWGFTAYTDGGFDFKKSMKPIWQDLYSGPSKAKTAVIHARQASPSTELVYQNAHPFIFQMDGEIWSFVHNGTISKHPESWRDELDSKLFANLIEERMKTGDPSWAFADAAGMIRRNCEFTSINSFLVSSGVFMALRLSDEPHRLFYNNRGDLFEISTEPLEESWSEMENGTMLIARRTKTGIRLETKPANV